MEIIKNIFNKLDFNLYPVVWLAFAALIALIPAIMYLPQSFGYENGPIECAQLLVLLAIFIISAKAKNHKRFFMFFLLIILMLMIREVNCGRTLFFQIPGTENSFYSWRDLKYGKLVHFLYGSYIAIVALLFFVKKIFLDLWKMALCAKIPFWNGIVIFFTMFMGAIAEKLTNNNFVFEEGFEFVFYVALMGVVWLYAMNNAYGENKNIEEETVPISDNLAQ